MKLYDAIRADDPDAVLEALKRVKDVNREVGGERPVFLAAAGGRAKVLPVLLDAGADPHDPHLPNGSAIALAAERGAADSIRVLLERIRPYPPEELLWAAANAARFGRIACLPALVHSGSNLDGAAEAAVAGGLVSTVKWLLKHGVRAGASIRVRGGIEQTLLHVAARHAAAAVVPVLVQAGADVNARDADGRTPLMVAAGHEPTEAMDRSMLRERMEDARRGGQDVNLPPPPDPADFTVADALLDAGADATLTDPDGSDAMRIFVREYEADLNSEPGEDDDAHWRLKLRLVKQIHARLKGAGARGPNAANEALLAAASDGDADAVRKALTAGAEVNARSVGGASVLWLAAASGSVAATRAVLEAGAGVNDGGRASPPLVAAAHAGHLDVVKLLVDVAADVDRRDPGSPSYNALVLAKINDKPAVVRYLKSVGARYPRPADWKPPGPGVAMWENFEDLLVRADANVVAMAIAKLVGGGARVEADAYGRELPWSAPAYAVLRVKGMDWTNVVRVPHDLWRFRTGEKYDEFAKDLARLSNASVLWIGYSDTSGTDARARFEPDGSTAGDDGTDTDTLEEAIGAMEALGEEIPDPMRQRLKDLRHGGGPEPLTDLAGRERFLCGAFGINVAKGEPCVVEFIDYPADVFDAVLFVTR